MAGRVHVTAIRNTDTESVKRVFTEILGEGFQQVELIESDGWVWFRSSVWGVGGGDLIKGIQALERPGVQITSADGDRFYAIFLRPGEEPETLVHSFGTHDTEEDEEWDESADYEGEYDDEPEVDPELAFLEEDRPEDAPPEPTGPLRWIARGYREEGLDFPEQLLEETRDLSYPDARDRFRKWHRRRFLELLASMGVDDADGAIDRALAWEGVTRTERYADLGNLPRLLVAMGLDGEWDEYVRQAEEADERAEDDDPDDYEHEYEPPDLIDPIRSAVADLELAPVAKGPVGLPIGDLDALLVPAEACSVEEWPGALIELRGDAITSRREELEPTLSEEGYRVEIRWDETGVVAGLQNHMVYSKDLLEMEIGERLADLLVSPPHGAQMTFILADQEHPETRHGYRGVIEDGQYLIDATHPAFDAETLAGALATCQRRGETSHRANDEEEAGAIMAASKRNGYLSAMDVERDGLTISCEMDQGSLAVLFLRHRYPDAWNFAPAMEHEEREYREAKEMERQLRRRGAEWERSRMAKRIGEPIYKGHGGAYWRSDVTAFDALDAEVLAKFEDGMAALGFRYLGDVTLKKMRGYALRMYLSPDGLSYADLTVSAFGPLCWEYVSRMADGSHLTTTTNPMAMSRPDVKIYFKEAPGLDPVDLYEKHRWAIGRFESAKNTRPVPLEGTLEGVARAIDEALERTERDEAENPSIDVSFVSMDDIEDDED
ncbi:MAG: hypothetical protein GF320_15220 [Armatimonadia bacterium]|nr:hypothetical protein [Armatimonadia bacterium]